MRYLTDRKRAIGNGSARQGTDHHWSMTVSSYGLLVLVPVFLICFAPMLGASYAEVTAHFAKPLPAIVTALTIWVGMMHFKNGVRAVIEDYVHGFARELWIIIMVVLSYAIAATGVFAILKMAL